MGSLWGLQPPGIKLCTIHTITLFKVISWSVLSSPPSLPLAPTSLHFQVSSSVSARSLPHDLRETFQLLSDELLPLSLSSLMGIFRSWVRSVVCRWWIGEPGVFRRKRRAGEMPRHGTLGGTTLICFRYCAFA